MLNINHISKQFLNHTVLDAVSFQINQGSIVGLAGSSGSGKSTLLRCVQGLEQPDSGEILYKGHCGFMFQDFQLFPHMNVLDNLTYAPMKTLGNSKEKADEKALHLLSQLGIQDKATIFPEKLSGGQKQRVALARSLMMEPDLLLCDEPTSGLDVATIQEVTQLLRTVHAMGVTILIASHDLDFLTQIAHRIIILKQGKIAADIHPASISNPIDYLKTFY